MIEPFKTPIYVTRPLLPPIEEYYKKIQNIWDSKWLTNYGDEYYTLNSKLKDYLEVDNLSLFCNGTLALELGLQALELEGEVITTPFTFPATITSLFQKDLKPIFCDIKMDDFNLDSEKIENLITNNTSAILAVHVFGNPCDVEEIKKIAEKYDLKIIYDAAHCFGVYYKNKSIGNYGDMSMFSFHATKIFHTIEGGALTYRNDYLKEKLSSLQNFGLAKNGEMVKLPGTNAKMNEFQAAMGILNLELIDSDIKKRKELVTIYREQLANLEGVKLQKEKSKVKYNYQYFPIRIEKEKFKLSRDEVLKKFKKYNIFTRKYFYPLCTEYKFIEKKNDNHLKNAKKVIEEILCLPIYSELSEKDIIKICDILKTFKNNAIK